MNGKYISIEEILEKANESTKSFIHDLELEELNKRNETVESIEREIEAHRSHTEVLKSNFISEMRNGLGHRIVENPTSVTMVKKPFWTKVGDSIKSLFTIF